MMTGSDNVQLLAQGFHVHGKDVYLFRRQEQQEIGSIQPSNLGSPLLRKQTLLIPVDRGVLAYLHGKLSRRTPQGSKDCVGQLHGKGGHVTSPGWGG